MAKSPAYGLRNAFWHNRLYRVNIFIPLESSIYAEHSNIFLYFVRLTVQKLHVSKPSRVGNVTTRTTAQQNFNVYRARIRTYVFLKIVIAVRGKISSRAEKDMGPESLYVTNVMLKDTEDDRETDEPARHADMLWREDEGECEPDIDDSLSQPLCEHVRREGRFLPS